MKVGDFVVERLHAWGVRRIYGYPGDGINGVIGALQRAGNIEFIQVRHEEMAAFMAVAHAKFTGELGVCLSTGGPGATHLITGLYDGKLDHAPVLAICGQAEATVRGASDQQELNLDRMFADVAGFVQEASSPAQVRHLLDRCVRVAKANNAPSVIILPKDIQDEEYVEPAVAHGFTRSGVGYSRPKVVPEDADLAKAAEILNDYRGNRTARDRAKLGSDARLRHAPDGRDGFSVVRISAQGRGRPRRSDRHRSGNALAALSGRRQPAWRRRRHVEGAAPSDPTQGRSEMVEDGRGQRDSVVGETGRPREGGCQSRQSAARRLGDVAFAAGQRHRHQRQRVMRQLVCPRLPGAAGPVFVALGRSGVNGGRRPLCVGAKFAHPDRPVIALVGDGAMHMNNMAELITVQKYWKRWIDPRWIVCVFNNRDLNEVTWEQRVMEGNPKFEASQDIPDFAYAKFGAMLGFKGIFVDTPDGLASAWQEALSSDRPVVLEVKTDPDVAPLPPHLTLKEARSFMSAMAKGDRGAGRVIGDTARQVVDGLFGKKD